MCQEIESDTPVFLWSISTLLGDGCSIRIQVQDALIATSPEVQRRVIESLDKWPIDKGIDKTQAVAGNLVLHQRLVGKACVAPDVLLCLALETHQQFEQSLRVVKGVAPRQGNTVEQAIAINLVDDARQYLFGKRFAGCRRPALGVVTPLTSMTTSGQVNGITKTIAVGYGLGKYIYNIELVH